MRIHLVLLAKFVAHILNSFSVLVPRMRVFYHIYCIFSGYPPAELAWSFVIKKLCESDRGCPVVEVNSI
jgi:hypothetical protein